MSNFILTPPYQPFTLDKLFKGVFNGYIYAGAVNATAGEIPSNQVQAYIEAQDGSLTEIAQPIRTNGGGFPVDDSGNIIKVIFKSAYSLLVQDKNQNQIWYQPNMAFFDPQSAISEFINEIEEVKNPIVTGGDTARPLGDILAEEGITAKDLGAKSDFTTDDTADIQQFAGIEKPKTTSLITVDPETIDSKNFENTALKYGNVKDFSQHFFNETVSKVSNGELYTAWTQDSCYVLNNQTRLWVGQKWSHADGQGMVTCLYSDDDDATFNSFVLDETLTTHSCWSAGIANGREYVIIRDDSTAPNYEHWVYKRDIPTGGLANYFDGWTVRKLTLPAPPFTGSGFQTNTVMIHSFTEGANGAVVVGAHNGNGAWLLESTDDMSTFTPYLIQQSASAEEPTVKFYNGAYYGFMRNGGGANPKYWHSDNADLSNLSLWTAPAGTFGPNPLDDCPMPLAVDSTGTIHAFVAYRNGILEGRPLEDQASMFYVTGKVVSGNFWSNCDVYRLGVAYHAETGGASAIGVGSVVLHNDKVNIYGGSEGRTGNPHTKQRVTDIFQFSFPLKKTWGAWDHRQRIALNGVAPYHVKRLRYENSYCNTMKFFLQYREVPSAAYINNKDFISVATGYCIDGGSSSSGYGVTTTSDYGYFAVWGNVTRQYGFRVGANTEEIDVMGLGGAVFKVWDGPRKCIRPVSDNDGTNVGASNLRFNSGFFVNPISTTCDETLKANFRDSSTDEYQKVVRAMKSVPMYLFEYKDSLFRKGGAYDLTGQGARTHFAPKAQDIIKALEAEGLDPFKYAVVRKVEWEYEPERWTKPELDDEGNIIKESGLISEEVQAGSRYEVVMEQFLLMRTS